MSPSSPEVLRLLFIGFNSRVVALQRETGELVWDWTSRAGSGYAAILVEADRVFASVNGYTYCLDARTGAELWHNPLSGLGTGVPCLATASSATGAHSALAYEAALAAQRAATTSATAGS